MLYSGSDLELTDLGTGLPAAEEEKGDGHRQPEAARPRASRIEKQDPAILLDPGRVAMSAHHHQEAGGRGFEVEMSQVVDHEDPCPGEVEDRRGRQPAGQRSPIYVPSHGGDRGDLPERLEDRRVADVTRMNYVVRAAQRLERRRAQQAVGIGDYA